MENLFHLSITQDDDVIDLPFLDDLTEAHLVLKTLQRLKTYTGGPALDSIILYHTATAGHDSVTTEISIWRPEHAD